MALFRKTPGVENSPDLGGFLPEGFSNPRGWGPQFEGNIFVFFAAKKSRGSRVPLFV